MTSFLWWIYNMPWRLISLEIKFKERPSVVWVKEWRQIWPFFQTSKYTYNMFHVTLLWSFLILIKELYPKKYVVSTYPSDSSQKFDKLLIYCDLLTAEFGVPSSSRRYGENISVILIVSFVVITYLWSIFTFCLVTCSPN